MCENDSIAAIFKNSLEKLGWSVPDDILLAEFDDVNIARREGKRKMRLREV